MVLKAGLSWMRMLLRVHVARLVVRQAQAPRQLVRKAQAPRELVRKAQAPREFWVSRS